MVKISWSSSACVISNISLRQEAVGSSVGMAAAGSGVGSAAMPTAVENIPGGLRRAAVGVGGNVLGGRAGLVGGGVHARTRALSELLAAEPQLGAICALAGAGASTTGGDRGRFPRAGRRGVARTGPRCSVAGRCSGTSRSAHGVLGGPDVDIGHASYRVKGPVAPCFSAIQSDLKLRDACTRGPG